MSVGDEDAVEPAKSDPGSENLALSAFTTVDEYAVIAKADDMRAQPAVNRGGRSRGAKENEFEQEVP